MHNRRESRRFTPSDGEIKDDAKTYHFNGTAVFAMVNQSPSHFMVLCGSFIRTVSPIREQETTQRRTRGAVSYRSKQGHEFVSFSLCICVVGNRL